LISLVGILQILYAIFSYLTTKDFDGLELSMYILIPVLFSTYLFYNLLKNPDFFQKYNLSFKIFSYGIIIGLILAILEFLIEIIFFHGEGFIGLMSLFIFVIILIISFVTSLVTMLVTFFKK